jgi:hypothetical protein
MSQWYNSEDFKDTTMPVHDWTKVESGIFHNFHQCWIVENMRMLNDELLPDGYYALAEQIAGIFIPDVLALQTTNPPGNTKTRDRSSRVQQLSERKPSTSYHSQSHASRYVNKTKEVAIRHVSDHSIIAVVEIVSPGNKSNRRDFEAFVEKSQGLLRQGIHLMVIDLFPPTPRDPSDIHQAIWKDLEEISNFQHSTARPLLTASYKAGIIRECFVEPFAVGDALLEMPVFLSADEYISLPLEKTYEKAWELVPEYWRDVIAG